MRAVHSGNSLMAGFSTVKQQVIDEETRTENRITHRKHVWHSLDSVMGVVGDSKFTWRNQDTFNLGLDGDD